MSSLGTPLYQYKNGNYSVRIFPDGTKERFTLEDEFLPDFPESIDLKITDYCDVNCPMCHENSSIKGRHGNLDAAFIATLHEGTELAIGGGNPLSHPHLDSFLKRLKDQGVIANMTINERHLLLEEERIKSYLDEGLIHGLGISINRYEDRTFEFARAYPNSVLHFILGIASVSKLLSVPKGLKALLLGYKQFGRGIDFYDENITRTIEKTEEQFHKVIPHFSHIAFDNLALEQLHVKDHLPPKLFERYFMGDDGQFTMYIDLVKEEFAISSTTKERYPMKNDIKEMFDFVTGLSK